MLNKLQQLQPPIGSYYNDLRDLTKLVVKVTGGTDFCIAGGAIRDLVMSRDEPRDIDIFLFNTDIPYAVWEGIFTVTQPATNHFSSADQCMGTFQWGKYIIQFCVEPEAKDPATLLSGFDFEECMFTLLPDGTVWTLANIWWTMVHGSRHQVMYNPKNRGIKNGHAAKSLRRLYRFCDRYEWTFSKETLHKLAKQVVKETSPWIF